MTADNSLRLALFPRYQSELLLSDPTRLTFPERHNPFGFTMRYSYLIATLSAYVKQIGCILSLPPTEDLVGMLSYGTIIFVCRWGRYRS